MGPARRSREGSDPVMVQNGRIAAEGLRASHGGSPEGGIGWRFALQAAAGHSRQDHEVLRVADDVYAIAGDLRTTAAINAFEPCWV